jgi:hypothetical protein
MLLLLQVIGFQHEGGQEGNALRACILRMRR